VSYNFDMLLIAYCGQDINGKLIQFSSEKLIQPLRKMGWKITLIF